MEYHTDSEHNDPADWHCAATWHTAVDELEPLPANSSEYREAAVRMSRVLHCLDTFLSCSRDARLAHVQVSIALGLYSTRGRSLSSVADELGITKQALSRGVARFLRMAGLEPAFGLKSTEARLTYMRCH